MAWNPANKKCDWEFILEARHHCHNAIKNTATGRWLDAALKRLQTAIAKANRVDYDIDA